MDNPHIFTHLFNGGVILNTRKLDYDASADEDVVKSLMQSQHKAVIKDLRHGTFDQKIVEYLGPHPESTAQETASPPVEEAPTEPAIEFEAEPAGPDELQAMTGSSLQLDSLGPTAADVSGLFDAIRDSEIPSGAAPVAAMPAPLEFREPQQATTKDTVEEPAPAGVTTYVQAGGVAKETPLVRTGGHRVIIDEDIAGEEPSRPSRARAQSIPPPIPRDARPSQRQAAVRPPSSRGPAQPATHSRRSTGGVVVSRPAVIINSPSKVVGGPAPRSKPASERARAQPAGSGPNRVAVKGADDKAEAGLFGQDLISEKSLDEVILAYLSEDGEPES